MSLFQKAQRNKEKCRLVLSGPSGSGKTFSALLIATGLAGEDGRIALIDTENRSASLYADRFNFDTAPFDPPYSPERYCEIITEAENDGYDVIIIDSGSHEWMGPGGILEIKEKMPGNDYTKWGKLTPRHEKFLQAILRSKAHVIVTLRSKQAYAMAEKDGKNTVEKLGLQSQMRDGFEYELTSSLQILKGQASGDKDRTGLFPQDHWFQPTVETGEQLAAWLDGGTDWAQQTIDAIAGIETQDDLKGFYQRNAGAINSHPKRDAILAAFTARKQELQTETASEE